MSVSEKTSIVTAIVAVILLLLSIYKVYVARREKRISLATKLSEGFEPPQQREQRHFYGTYMLFLEVANSGEKEATITDVDLVWRGIKVQFPSPGYPSYDQIQGTEHLPFKLAAGNSAMFWISWKDIKLRLQEMGALSKIKIKASFQDALGNRYPSNNLTFNIKDEVPFNDNLSIRYIDATRSDYQPEENINFE